MSAPTFALMSPRYAHWLSQMKVVSTRTKGVAAAASLIAKNKTRYQEVCTNLGLSPDWWIVVGAIHYRESDCNFKTHLANGDSLAHKTVHVPRGGPPGTPPFKWEYSAEWSLRREGAHNLPRDYSPEHAAYFCEGYNGWGYEMKGRPSSYLWAGTNVSPHGKFVRDGRFSVGTVDEQEGVMPLLALLAPKAPEPKPIVVAETPKAAPEPKVLPEPAAPAAKPGLITRLKEWLHGPVH